VKLCSRTSRAAFLIVFFVITASHSGILKADSQAAAVEDLQQQIAERDSIIRDLARRVETLEERLPKPTPADQTEKQSPEPKESSTSAAATDDEGSRALERTLVREGGLVLPEWSMEIEPRYIYRYRGSNSLQLATLSGQQVIAQQDIKRDISEVSLALRAGLPWTSQLDFRLPYIFDRQEIATAGSGTQKHHRSGLGDIELGLTKSLTQERGWMPDLLTALNWKSKTGGTETGSGFHGIQTGLTAVKRLDPLAFFGTVAYTWNLSDKQAGNDVDPGNSVLIRLGNILATSPETSLRAVLEINRFGKTELNRRKLAGSDPVVAMFEFGLATVVLPRMLLDIRAGIGLTSDSPDFRLDLALPFRLLY
jgi:hypothetical protein